MSRSKRLLAVSFLAFCAVVGLSQNSALAACGDVTYNGGCEGGGYTMNFPGASNCAGGFPDYDCANSFCHSACNTDVENLGFCHANEWSSWFWFTCETPI